MQSSHVCPKLIKVLNFIGLCSPKLIKIEMLYVGTCYPKLLINNMLNIGTHYPKLHINEMLDIGIRYPKLLKNERHDTYTKAPVRNGINNTGPHVDTTVTRDWYVIFDTIYDQDTTPQQCTFRTGDEDEMY